MMSASFGDCHNLESPVKVHSSCMPQWVDEDFWRGFLNLQVEKRGFELFSIYKGGSGLDV